MGTTHREREFKLGIPDEVSFDRLLAAAGGQREEPVEQVNHFFDTAKEGLRARSIGLRVRREAGRFILTLKGPASAETGTALLAERCELESEFPAAEAEATLAGEKSALDLLSYLEALPRNDPATEALLAGVREAAADSPLSWIGAFSNQRTRVRTNLELDSGRLPVTLEFDCTYFAEDDVRREVELEIGEGVSIEAIEAALCAFFEREGVSPAPTTSKLAYFSERLRRSARARESQGEHT